MEAINYENYLNQNLCAVRNRMRSKQEMENIRSINEDIMKRHEGFNNEKFYELDCEVYLYEGVEGDSTPKQALVFHFKHSFIITVEGIVVDGRITNLEFIGLPDAGGKYYLLTPKCIKCIPNNVISCSKKNKLNGTGILNSRDWNFQTLASLGLDELVQNISLHRYVASAPPQIEPPRSLCDNLKDKVEGAVSYLRDGTKNKKSKEEKKPVHLPQITVPHVPSEYDQKVRDAVVIRYYKGEECGLIFHFLGDDSFRTIKGVWDENVLKPSLIKQRPNEAGETSLDLGVVQISPVKVREMVLDNKYNGVKIDSGITEIDWAKQICKQIGLYEHWDKGTPWEFSRPPQYTVAPDKTVLTFHLPSS